MCLYYKWSLVLGLTAWTLLRTYVDIRPHWGVCPPTHLSWPPEARCISFRFFHWRTSCSRHLDCSCGHWWWRVAPLPSPSGSWDRVPIKQLKLRTWPLAGACLPKLEPTEWFLEIRSSLGHWLVDLSFQWRLSSSLRARGEAGLAYGRE